MSILILDQDDYGEGPELDAAIEAADAEFILHRGSDWIYAEDHADALIAAIGDKAMAHSLQAQLHPNGLITAAPIGLTSPEMVALMDESDYSPVTRAVSLYRRAAYLNQGERWHGRAPGVMAGLARQGAVLVPRITALQRHEPAEGGTPADPPPSESWTGSALFGAWLTHTLHADHQAGRLRNTDEALERYGFPGRAGDSWFDEEIELSEAQKADLRGAFHLWRKPD